MADEKEELILDLKIDQGSLNSDLKKSTTNIVKLKEAQTALRKEYISGKKTVEEYAVENAKLNNDLKEEQNTVKNLTAAQKIQSNSIEDLRKKTKDLTAERNKLDITTKQGQQRLKEINKELDANNEAIKNNVSALEKQKINIGNYSSALDRVIPGLGGMVSGLGAATKAALAFIATPLGLILTGIAGALLAVKTALTSSEEGQNKLNKIMKVGEVVLGNILDVVADVGEAIIELGEGLFNAAKAFTDFIGLTDEGTSALGSLNKELERAAQLADLSAETDILERNLIVQKAILESQVAERKLRAEDKSLDIKERQKALVEALAIQDKLSELEIAAAKNRLQIKKEENSFSKSTKEDLREEAELEARLFQIQKEASDKKTELFTKEQALRQEILNITQAQINADRAAAAELDKQQSERFDKNRENEKKIIDDQIESQTAQLEALKAFDLSKIQEIGLTENQIREEAARTSQIRKQLDNESLGNTKRFLAAGSELAGKQSKEGQVLAGVNASISAFEAANAALKNPPGPPFTFPIAGLTLAIGLKNAKEIAGFAEGGFTGAGGKYQPAGIVHKGEVVWNQQDVALSGGPSVVNAMRPTAKSRNSIRGQYFDGGVVTNTATQETNNAFSLFNAIKSLPAPVVGVKQFADVQNEVNVKQNISKA